MVRSKQQEKTQMARLSDKFNCESTICESVACWNSLSKFGSYGAFMTYSSK
jgi:hypothetical protein